MGELRRHRARAVVSGLGVAGPIWLYGKSQQETRALYGHLLKNWWWAGLLILLALAVLLAVIGVPADRRRQARTGPPRLAQSPPILGAGRQPAISASPQAQRDGHAPVPPAAPPGPAQSAEDNGLLISNTDLAVTEPGTVACAARPAATDPSGKIMRTALLLRPFWESSLTAHQLTIVARLVEPYGRLIAIRNGNEKLPAREVEELNIELISAADDAWKENAIEYIQQADVVIAHIAPRDRYSDELLTPIVPSPTPHSTDDDLLREQVHSSGGGHGVLLELEYCRRAKACPKLLVLVPESFKNRLADVLHAVDLQQTGTWWTHRGGALKALTPRVTALDEALSVLKEARAVITYRRFGDPEFCARLEKELSELMSSSSARSCEPASKIHTGVPVEPVALPPDGELKRIRFTPIQDLLKIPCGNIVELSLDEVLPLYPKIVKRELRCPRCGSKSDAMFWYQYSLVPDLSGNTDVFMRCQYCGDDEYL